MTPSRKTTDVIVLLIYTFSQMTPLHYKARKCGEATEEIKENKEICSDKEGRKQSAWIDSAVKSGKSQIW